MQDNGTEWVYQEVKVIKKYIRLILHSSRNPN